jgi:quercetin dioxygenase-like cupin family protein
MASEPIARDVQSAELVLPCEELEDTLRFFTDELGLRVEAIHPAEDPRVAVVSGHGVRLRLERGGAGAPGVLRLADAAWTTGRAGMRYRDLIPDKQGGRFTAAHIQIPGGGPVLDYVHDHAVRFQSIHCAAGWVRVVYEDQGEPFEPHAGECVLQSPGIRHRVLAAARGLQVVELSSPAGHATRADHELELLEVALGG